MSSVHACLVLMAMLAWLPAASPDNFAHITFDGAPTEDLFINEWGDVPARVLANGAEPDAGRDGPGGHLKLQFGEDCPHNLSYWHIKLPRPVPIAPQVQEIAFWVRTNVPVQIKVGIETFGFIYHGPGVGPAPHWQQVKLTDAYEELRKWCQRGNRNPDDGFVTHIIVALSGLKNALADVYVDDVTVSGPEGTLQAVEEEARRRRYRRVRASVVTLPWSDEGRSLPTVLDRLDEAGAVGSDIVCLPMECVQTEGEPIPGPISQAIADKAAQWRMYVIGNLREREGDRVYVTSFLCGRDGSLIGKYRKSHKLPDEDMDLGDELPVFPTDFAPIAMRIGSDRYFADIDHVYTAKGARMIFWSQQPEPVEDEYLQDFPSAGRAVDYNVFIACARYSFAGEGWITSYFPPYRGCPIGRSYIINREGERIACTPRKGSVATAVIPLQEFHAPGRGPNRARAFACLTEPVNLPPKRQWAKRKIRITAIENHVPFEELLSRLDEAGRLGSDIVCTYEFVWISGGSPGAVETATATAKERLWQVAQKAKQWGMYVLIGGVVDRLERNEAICYGRDGKEIGRYFKIVKTHEEQIAGDDTPLFETDFGRFGVRICADNYMVELDRAYGVKGADLIFFLTQDWGPDALYRNLREISRCMDAQLFHVQATHSSSEVMHRSMIVEPTGVTVACSQYLGHGLVSAVVDLDNDRPRRYVRNWKPHTPGGYLPQYQSTELPEERNDLKETILMQRRPELYQALAPQSETP